MRSVRRPLVVLALCFAFAFVPVASQAAARTAPLSLPSAPAFDLEALLGNALSAVQSFMSKILVSGGGDDGTTSTTPTTPSTGTGTPPDGSGENGPGIDPNG